MRNFADYRSNSSEEYRLMYLHEVDQNKKLKLVNEDQQTTIEDLRKQLAEMTQKFTESQNHVEVLEEKLQKQAQKASNLEQKQEESERKIVEATQECQKQEERVNKVKALSVEMLNELDQADQKIQLLESRVDQQADFVKQNSFINKELSQQVQGLKKTQIAAEIKSAKTAKLIHEVNVTVFQQQNTIKMYEDFKSRFQERESKRFLKLEALEMHQHGKFQSRVFSSFHRPSQSQELVKSIRALFESNIISGIEAHLEAESNERLI
ncbi:golgin subfamily A member 6-like protein 25 [Clytia hemisphaerica]|uniref:golgin subfamily A member 6-like protein 25 n=1 Tax=Clytia hemisphaerica TaxID=252671 RepID=UPI0034D4DDF5